jgi:2-polyprenyl-6-methoxyphenol hydroxylase-like FAD-dependent oxidoreductase
MQAAVVGCGIGGMAAALALARRGWSVTLLESFDQPRPMGSGLLLQPSGLAALRSLGLEEAARDCGAEVRRLDGRDRKGRLVLELDYDRWRPGATGVGIHRAALFDILYSELAAAGVRLVTNAHIVQLENPVRPLLHDAQSRSFGPFDLAVIADGCASELRAAVRPDARAPVYPWGAVWANCPAPDGAFDGVLRQLYDKAEVMIGALPVGRAPGKDTRLVSLFWSLPVTEMDAFFAGDFQAWKARVAELWPQAGALISGLTDASQMSRAVYRDVRVGRWNNGACVLIGDAAHGTSPQLGQGANLALTDAVVLAERLATLKSRPVAARLHSFQASRRAHAGLYQLASRWLTPLFQSRGRFWPAMRDLFLVPTYRLPGLGSIAAATLVGVARFPWGGRLGLDLSLQNRKSTLPSGQAGRSPAINRVNV